MADMQVPTCIEYLLSRVDTYSSSASCLHCAIPTQRCVLGKYVTGEIHVYVMTVTISPWAYSGGKTTRHAIVNID